MNELIFQYPFLEGGKDIFDPPTEEEPESFHIYYTELFTNHFQKHPTLIEYIPKIFEMALSKNETVDVIKNDEFNIILYYTIKTILLAIENPYIENHVANMVAKTYNYHMDKLTVEEIIEICNRYGLNITFNGGRFEIPFLKYLKSAVKMKNKDYALVNQTLDKGTVYLNRHKTIRIFTELIREDITPKQRNKGELLTLLKSINIMELILHDIEQTYLKYRTMKHEFNIENITTNTELHPPCIRYLQSESEKGVNLTHSERLHLAIFYSHIGKDTEEIIDVFRNSPDFDEGIARYQVEHLRGIGKGKEYSIFSCDKLKTIGICKATDPIFGDRICIEGVRRKGDTTNSPISTPKDFVFWKNVYSRREKKKDEGNTPN